MKHCIIVKYTEEVSPERKKTLIPEIQALFDNTKSIEGVHAVTLRENVIDRPNRYDLVIELDMEPEALPVYDACIWHKQWKTDYSTLLKSKAIIDLE